MALATKKKRDSKENENAKVRDLIQSYKNIIIIQTENQRSNFIQQLRNLIREDSKILFGKKKVLQKSLESTKLANIDKFTQKLGGNCFLVFTDRNVNDFSEFIEGSKVCGFLRPGDVCSREVVLSPGIVQVNGSDVPVDFGDKLRECGVLFEIKKGKIVIDKEQIICGEGDVVDNRVSKLLRLLGHQLAVLNLKIIDSFAIKN